MCACLPSRRPRFFYVFLVSLLLNYFVTLTPAQAISIYNRYPWPTLYQSLDIVTENTDYLDAVGTCSRTQGRSFTFSHPDSFKLAGLSVYVYMLRLQSHRFDPSLFKLSLLDPSHKGSFLASGVASTYSQLIDLDLGLNSTFEVFFPLDVNVSGEVSYTALLDCQSSEEDLFQIPESSRLGDGLVSYYDFTSNESSPYPGSGRKILFTTFSPRGAPHFPPVPPPTNKEQSTNNPLPRFHPVIFVHGLGGDPTNFESDTENRNYVRLLTDLGYPKDYIYLYSYGYKYDSIKRVNYYNYQGDVKEIAEGMEVVVSSLSDKHKGQGGDGQVDIVAHSLGNLVTRQYLLTHKDNHRIRRYIAVGAPFKGTWVMALDKNISSFPILGKTTERLLADSILDIYNKENKNAISRNSVASIQATPGSDFLEGPEGINKTNISGIEFYSIYGNINATIRQKVFSKTFERKLDLGDGIILEDSATYAGWVSNSKKFAHNDGVIFDFKVNPGSGALAAQFQIANPKSLRTLHTELLTRPDSQGKILCLLSKDSPNSCN